MVAAKYEDRTVEDLRELARERDLKVSGTKDELIARLRGEELEAAPAPAPSADEERAAKFEKDTKAAKPKHPEASLGHVRKDVAALLEVANAEPGNGRVLWHLNNIASELDALDQAADTEARMVRPEGE